MFLDQMLFPSLKYIYCSVFPLPFGYFQWGDARRLAHSSISASSISIISFWSLYFPMKAIQRPKAPSSDNSEGSSEDSSDSSESVSEETLWQMKWHKKLAGIRSLLLNSAVPPNKAEFRLNGDKLHIGVFFRNADALVFGQSMKQLNVNPRLHLDYKKEANGEVVSTMSTFPEGTIITGAAISAERIRLKINVTFLPGEECLIRLDEFGHEKK